MRLKGLIADLIWVSGVILVVVGIVKAIVVLIVIGSILVVSGVGYGVYNLKHYGFLK